MAKEYDVAAERGHRSDWSCPRNARDSALDRHPSIVRATAKRYRSRFQGVEWRQDLTKRAIRQLRFIVDGFLTRLEYQHLVNIRDGSRNMG
jgi:hypothetical protein